MIVALWLALAAAQDTAPPARLKLDEAYQLARAQNPRVEAARAIASAADARIPGAKLPPDPQLQLGFMNYSIPGFAPMDPIGMTQLQLMQMIPTAGKLRLNGYAAQALAAAAAERARDVEWDVRSQVAMMFYDLYATDRELEVSRETLRLLHDIRTVAEAMYRVGDGRQTDVLRAQVEIGRMVEDTVRMTTMRVGMAARLNALLNRPADTRVSSPVLPGFPESVIPVETALERSESGRPMVRAALRDVDAASARATLARRELWPDLTVGLQYAQQGSAMGTEHMGSLMLGASVPIFAQRRQIRMRDEALAMRRMAEAELADMRARTQADVMNAYATLIRARNLATLYRTTIIPQAEAAVASALAAYRVGRVDFMTLLDDRMTVNSYRRQLFALEAEQGKSWAELEMLQGRELLHPNTVARSDIGASESRR
ncbi:MAG: TolC family protein [Gemmatimonadaceae bacterium]